MAPLSCGEFNWLCVVILDYASSRLCECVQTVSFCNTKPTTQYVVPYAAHFCCSVTSDVAYVLCCEN